MIENEFKARLTKKQYAVLREKATEPPFSGELLHNSKSGSYLCAACGAELFDSKVKFDSGSGWPSFYDVANSKNIKFEDDMSLGVNRVEVTCVNCGSHLGHVFDDAPQTPTGKRYCINSCALDFKPGSKQK